MDSQDQGADQYIDREAGERRPTLLRLGAFACGIALLSACSTAAWYEGLRRGAETQCRQAIPADVEQCLARLNTRSYEQYDAERSRQR